MAKAHQPFVCATAALLCVSTLLSVSSSLTQSASAVTSPASVELPQLRARTSRTFSEPDGTFRTSLFSGPVNFRDAAGNWQPISSALVPSGEPGYSWENEANSFQTVFRQQLAADYLRLEIEGKSLTVALRAQRLRSRPPSALSFPT
jgi:hypothetical protein